MYCENCGTKLDDGVKFCTKCGTRVFDQKEQTAPEKKRKGTKKKIVIGVVLAFFLIFASLAFFMKDTFLKKSESVCVYLADGKYVLVPDGNKDKMFEFASSEGGESTLGSVFFSADGKYLYFLTECKRLGNAANGVGTLYRAEYEKLKKDSSINDKYIQMIDSNVVDIKTELVGENVIYVKNDLEGVFELWCYDGKKNVQIEKAAVAHHITADVEADAFENIIYYLTEDQELYAVDLEHLLEKKKLDTGIKAEDLYGFDGKNIFYRKDESTLYVAEFSEGVHKLCENILDMDIGYFTEVGDCCFYFVENGKTVNLYDYVRDNYAETDAEMKEPDIEDYEDESFLGYDFEEFDEACDRYNQAKERNALREELKRKENEYPLKSLFCYKNGESSLVCDNVLDYRYEKSSGSSLNGGLTYKTLDMVKEHIRIEDMEEWSDIEHDLFSIEPTEENYILVDGQSVRVSEEAASFFEKSESQQGWPTWWSASKEKFYLSRGEGIACVNLKNGKMTDFQVIAEEGKFLFTEFEGDGCYYATDIYESEDAGSWQRYGDVWLYKDGKHECCMKDVAMSWVQCFEDGKTLGITAYNREDSSLYELSMADRNGKNEIIDENIFFCCRINEQKFIYIADGGLHSKGKLYCYDVGAGVRTLLSENVEWFWTNWVDEPNSDGGFGVFV